MTRPRVFLDVDELACDICSDSRVPVLRFSLVRAVKGPNGQRATSRGAGTVFLCERCWRTTAKRRRRQFGPRHIRAEQALA